MSRVVNIHETGGPDVLRLERETQRALGDGEVLVRIRSIGLNRAEVMYRSDVYARQPDTAQATA
jgi:NADPH:quinone reductase